MWQKCIIFYTIFAISVVKSSKINFRENAYEDLVVTIHPDVSDTYGNDIINGIKTLITDGSKRLFIATKGYAYIKVPIIFFIESRSLSRRKLRFFI